MEALIRSIGADIKLMEETFSLPYITTLAREVLQFALQNQSKSCFSWISSILGDSTESYYLKVVFRSLTLEDAGAFSHMWLKSVIWLFLNFSPYINYFSKPNTEFDSPLNYLSSAYLLFIISIIFTKKITKNLNSKLFLPNNWGNFNDV